MIPLKDINPTTRTAWVTIGLIAVNVVVFLLWQPTFSNDDVKQEFFFFCHAEIPWEVTHQTNLAQGGEPAREAMAASNLTQPATFQQILRHGGEVQTTPNGPPEHIDGCPGKSWWQSVFVAMFLHGGWLHIGGNMLFLWIFGNNVEDKIGPFFYLIFYFLSGIAATALQTATSPSAAIPNLGASGAIAGVLGAYLVMFPRRRVLVAIFFFLITMIEVPAVVVLGFWFVLQAFNGTTSLTHHITGGVAYFAHVGGFVFGVLVALALFPKEWRQREVPTRPAF